MLLLKFGGKSLANGRGIENVISIITSHINSTTNIAVVLSARGNSTNDLEIFLDLAKNGKDFSLKWDAFKLYQITPYVNVDLSHEFDLLENIFNSVKLAKDYCSKTKDLILAQGEILSTKLVAAILNNNGINSIAVDSRLFLKTDSSFGDANLVDAISAKKTVDFFNSLDNNLLPIITGFIASNNANETTTLGRNGSNYSASIIANYLNASKIKSFTHVNGIYTANPDNVSNATLIEHLSFAEANVLANFGASILHPKTISPLVDKDIPLQILNSFNCDNNGTTISSFNTCNYIKSIAVQNNISVITLNGFALSKFKNRIFNVLRLLHINVFSISYYFSKTNFSFVIPNTHTNNVISALNSEFTLEFFNSKINSISANNNFSVVTIIGRNATSSSSIFRNLTTNNIPVILTNKNCSGNNVGFITANNLVGKAVNIIHSEIFSVPKKINVFSLIKKKLALSS